ncbi:MAG TPA: TonB-dependent receptor [Ferruginibacter sp.]|nr:TonB-dependent receptor [Ferruginibacter sp.]HMP22389.1 TonB-dependent receptor [Ferruginibacter sp.]
MLLPRSICVRLFFILLLLAGGGAYAQLRTITGTIKDEKDNPLVKATIRIKGEKEGVAASALGTFSISVPATTTVLVISCAEFITQEVNIAGKTEINIVLQPLIKRLDDVVVIGYGTQKVRDVTGSVGSVKGSEIKDLPVQNVAEAIQSRIAGIDVTKSTGEPGTSAQITIRGVSSLFQANPLYVIDGVVQRTNPVGGGAEAGNNINPKDIASIDVLKDASAKSIYGAAAAGGVIVITTKKGQGKPVINFSARYGITQPRVFQLLDTSQFFNQLDVNTFRRFINDDRKDTFANSNWVDAMFGNGIEENYNLSVSGSTPNINYYFSGAYNNQKGVYLNNNSNVYNIALNTDFKINDHIKIGEQISAYQRSTMPVDYGSDPTNSVLSPRVNPPFYTLPIISVFGDEPGTYGANVGGFNGVNPVAQILSKTRNITISNIQANVYAEVKLPAALTFRTTVGYSIYNEQGNSFNGSYVAGSESINNSILFKGFVSYKNLLNAFTLAHDKSYGKNNINAMVGYEQYKGLYNALFTSQTNVIPSSYAYFPTSATIDNIVPGGYDPFPLVKSYFGRLNYNYDEKYYASVSVRQDADYIRFGPGRQKGVFPAASVGWKVSEEEFFKKAFPKISFLKFRASIGVVGNSNIPVYKFLSGYGPYASDPRGNSTSNAANFSPGGPAYLTYTITNLANENIKWESTRETNFGIDAEAFDGKLFFTLEYYSKFTKDLLYNLPIPISSGFSNYFANIGSTRNTGVDLLLGYKGQVKAVNYTLTLTGSYNTNKVVDLVGTSQNPIRDGHNDYPPFGGQMFGIPLTHTAAGAPFGQFYGLKALGIYQTNEEAAASGHSVNGTVPRAGDLKYWDRNGDNIINRDDDTIIGNPYPKFIFGLNTKIQWKGFDLNMLWRGVAGVDVFNGVAPYAQGLFSNGNTTEQIFNASFFGTNGVTSQPRIGRLVVNSNGTSSFDHDTYGNYRNPSSYFVEDGSYIKLQNIQLGYTFSNKLLSKIKIRSARFFVMGNNLLFFTKYTGIDPELGSQNMGSNGGTTNRGIDGPYKYPSIRTYSTGIDISF